MASLSGKTSYYVTTTAFLTLPIYYKLQKTQCFDEYSVYKVNPLIHFNCELHETVQVRMLGYQRRNEVRI